jgi:hypothetical protein
MAWVLIVTILAGPRAGKEHKICYDSKTQCQIEAYKWLSTMPVKARCEEREWAECGL